MSRLATLLLLALLSPLAGCSTQGECKQYVSRARPVLLRIRDRLIQITRALPTDDAAKGVELARTLSAALARELAELERVDPAPGRKELVKATLDLERELGHMKTDLEELAEAYTRMGPDAGADVDAAQQVGVVMERLRGRFAAYSQAGRRFDSACR